MAERVGFEPTIPVKVCPLSRRIVSTAHAPLRMQLSAVSEPGFLASLGMTILIGWPTIDGQRLTTVFKERLQQFGAAACQNSAADFCFVVELLVVQQLHYRIYRARFRVVCAVDEALDPCVHHCSGAHWARFNCSKQVTLGKPMVTDGCASFAERDHFGVRRGIVIGDIAVPAAADDSSLGYNDGAYRNFARFESTLSCTQRFFHPEFVRTRRWSLVVGRWHRSRRWFLVVGRWHGTRRWLFFLPASSVTSGPRQF